MHSASRQLTVVVVGVSFAAAVVVFVAAVDVVESDDAVVVVVVVDDVCTMDGTVDVVIIILSVAVGFGELTGFGLSTLRGLALAAATEAGIGAGPLVFASFALLTGEAVGVAARIDVVFPSFLSSVFDVMVITCLSSLLIERLLVVIMPFGPNVKFVIAANGFGGG